MAMVDLKKMLEEQKKKEKKEREKRKKLEQKIWEQKYKTILDLLTKNDGKFTDTDVAKITGFIEDILKTKKQ